uniref:Thioredoxin domain-containing protein n=1 Tax=Heterosigma akashiwo TaxID=2829 RepID=A0A7S4DD81_HETAK
MSRDIVQDEFLPEVTGSKNVIVHFYHKNFEKCKIMDKHLALLAPHHIEAKFLKIDAEKAPFFVAKLQIPVLPTVVLFVDGVACGRVVGFEGLTDEDAPSRDEWETYRLAEKLAEGGVIEYRDIDGVTCNEDARAAEAAQAASAVRRGFHTRHADDDL